MLARQNAVRQKRPFECVHKNPGPITCPNCDKNGFDYDFVRDDVHGDIVCPDCGCCVDVIFDEGPEKRTFVDGKNHARTIETDPLLGILTHTTIIGKPGAHNQLQQTQTRLAPTESKKSAKLSKSFKTLRGVEAQVGCKSCVTNTAKWYMSQFDSKLGKRRVNGTATVEFSTAVLYLASLYHEQGMAFADMCNKVTADGGRLADTQTVRRFIGEFQRVMGSDVEHPTPNPATFVEQIAFNFDLDYKVTGRAFELVDRAQNHICGQGCGKPMTGMRPSTLAAACFYKASCILQKELGFVPLKDIAVADCAGIEKGTLTAACSSLESHWSAMFPNEKK